jgi:hypothetical protein
MSIVYNTVIRQAALRVNAFTTGTTPTLLQNAYITSPLTATQLASPDFPFQLFLDTCLLVEERLSTRIANNKTHPYRAFFTTQTADIANKAEIPKTDSSSNPIVGVYGAVFDSSDSLECEEMSAQDITIKTRNANSWQRCAIYGYRIVGRRMYHTRTNVKIDVCTYNRTTQGTSIATLTNASFLPDALEWAFICGMVELLVRDGAFESQAKMYADYFNGVLDDLGPAQLAQAA